MAKFGALRVFLEARLPLILSVAAGYIVFSDYECIKNYEFYKTADFGDLSSAVANISAIATGFVMTFYGVVVSSSSDFIAKIKHTPIFLRYISFLKSAMFASFFSSLFSVSFSFLYGTNLWEAPQDRYMLSLWAFVVVYTVLAVTRIIRSTFIVLESKPPKKLGGG
ncbi:hypothetical protein [Caenispirillum salinarum]|uniref:hypothetical protein n=1 Tax=Caenispirillum salinarum TaxID=859058 RepID=UPI0012675C26|nr:hypothetical protein [Caenispirillum salinarum]